MSTHLFTEEGGQGSIWMDDSFSVLLMSLMTMQLRLVEQNLFQASIFFVFFQEILTCDSKSFKRMLFYSVNIS